MKKSTVFFLAICVMALVPVWAFAGATTVEGTIQGFTCVTIGKVCPVGMEDPTIAAEKVFVVLTKTGSYYFVPNLDRGIMARHINTMVRVTGNASAKYPSIHADTLEVMKGGAWALTWSQKLEAEARAVEAF
jgi:hypothetical protein